MKSGRRACSPDGFRSFLRGGQAAKPLCPPTMRNAKRSESGVLKIDTKLKKKAERSFSLHPQAVFEWLPLYAEKTFFRKAFSDAGKAAALFCGSAGACEIA